MSSDTGYSDPHVEDVDFVSEDEAPARGRFELSPMTKYRLTRVGLVLGAIAVVAFLALAVWRANEAGKEPEPVTAPPSEVSASVVSTLTGNGYEVDTDSVECDSDGLVLSTGETTTCVADLTPPGGEAGTADITVRVTDQAGNVAVSAVPREVIEVGGDSGSATTDASESSPAP